MKKKIIKISLFVIFSLFIFTSGVVAAKLTAKDIEFTSTNEEWNVNNVEDAMNDLYNANKEAKDNNFSAFMMTGITGEKAAPFSYSTAYNGSQYGTFSTTGFATNNEISFTFTESGTFKINSILYGRDLASTYIKRYLYYNDEVLINGSGSYDHTLEVKKGDVIRIYAKSEAYIGAGIISCFITPAR